MTLIHTSVLGPALPEISHEPGGMPLPAFAAGKIRVEMAGVVVDERLDVDLGVRLHLALSVAICSNLYQLPAPARDQIARRFVVDATSGEPDSPLDRLRWRGLRAAALAALDALSDAGTTVELPPIEAGPLANAFLGSLRGEPPTEAARALMEWAEWLLSPDPAWSAWDIRYVFTPEDRALYWCGLAQCTDPDAFVWLRSGHLILHECDPLETGIGPTARAALCALLTTVRAPDDFRDWQDRIVTILPAVRAELFPAAPDADADDPVERARAEIPTGRLGALRLPDNALVPIDKLLIARARTTADVRAVTAALRRCAHGSREVDQIAFGRFVLALSRWSEHALDGGLVSLPRWIRGEELGETMWRVQGAATHPHAVEREVRARLGRHSGRIVTRPVVRELLAIADHLAEQASRARGAISSVYRTTGADALRVRLAAAAHAADVLRIEVVAADGTPWSWAVDSAGRLRLAERALVPSLLVARIGARGQLDVWVPPAASPGPSWPPLDVGDQVDHDGQPATVVGWGIDGRLSIQRAGRLLLSVSPDDVRRHPVTSPDDADLRVELWRERLRSAGARITDF